MPLFSVRSFANRITSSWSISFIASLSVRTSRASETFIFFDLLFFGNELDIISLIFMPISSMPIGPKTCIPIVGSSETSTSIIFSSKSPSSNFFLIRLRVLAWRSFNFSSCLELDFFSSGYRISNILSFARCSASSITS